jgi:hypothetical protein
MSDIDVDRLIPIVTGVQLKAELGDRPLAYRVEGEIRRLLRDILGEAPENEPPKLAPIVLSDVYYLNSEEMQQRPTLSLGGPGVNMLSANLVEKLPTVIAIENVLVIQMDPEWHDLRCCAWGMDHLSTVRAVETLLVKGYLEAWVKAVAERQAESEI